MVRGAVQGGAPVSQIRNLFGGPGTPSQDVACSYSYAQMDDSRHRDAACLTKRP